MTDTAISLCSVAMMRLGANAIASFEEGTVESDIASALYPQARDFLLGAYPWSFATAQRRLPQLSVEPVSDFKYAFQKPADFLRALSLGRAHPGSGGTPSSRGLEYRIRGDEIHANSKHVLLNYIFRPEIAQFPPYFVKALGDLLSAEFCLPIIENTSRSELLHRLSETSFQIARLTDAQSNSPLRVEDYSLIDARNESIGSW